MYKVFTKTKSDTYDDISRQAYGTTTNAGDIARLNNNIEEGEVLAYIEDEEEPKAPENGKVLLQVDGVNYDDFSQYRLIDILGGVRAAIFIFNKTDREYDFKMGDEVVVFDEDGLFLKGRITIIDGNLDERVNYFQVEIKSHAGELLDTDMPYPNEFNHSSIRNILQSVATCYNQKITFSEEKELDEIFVNEIGTSFSASNKEKVLDFMTRVCDSRGLLIQDTGDGLFVGRFKANTEEKLNLIDGACLGLKNIRLLFNGNNLARYYELNSQYPEPASYTVQIPFPIPIISRKNSNDYNASDLPSITKMIACQEIGKHLTLTAILSENKNIKAGSFAIVKNKKIKINKETDFVIKQVERRHPDLTIIIMTLPCAYTFEIPEELPLC